MTRAGYKLERFEVKNSLTLKKKSIIIENMKNENIDKICIPLFWVLRRKSRSDLDYRHTNKVYQDLKYIL